MNMPTLITMNYRAHHDHTTQATYIYLPNHPGTHGCVAETRDLGHGLALDYNNTGQLIGIEHLW